MQCPYCRTPLSETSEECSYCNLSLQSANALLGPVPRLTPGLNDTLCALDKKSRHKITKTLAKLSRRFPQVRMHVVTFDFDQKYSISTHLFWLFNQGIFCASDRKGGKNHTILLGLDTLQLRVGIIVGYGLEPFLAQKSLDQVLEKAHPLLNQASYSEAILRIIDEIYKLMEEVCNDLNELLDLDDKIISQQTEY